MHRCYCQVKQKPPHNLISLAAFAVAMLYYTWVSLARMTPIKILIGYWLDVYSGQKKTRPGHDGIILGLGMAELSNFRSYSSIIFFFQMATWNCKSDRMMHSCTTVHIREMLVKAGVCFAGESSEGYQLHISTWPSYIPPQMLSVNLGNAGSG